MTKLIEKILTDSESRGAGVEKIFDKGDDFKPWQTK